MKPSKFNFGKQEQTPTDKEIKYENDDWSVGEKYPGERERDWDWNENVRREKTPVMGNQDPSVMTKQPTSTQNERRERLRKTLQVQSSPRYNSPPSSPRVSPPSSPLSHSFVTSSKNNPTYSDPARHHPQYKFPENEIEAKKQEEQVKNEKIKKVLLHPAFIALVVFILIFIFLASINPPFVQTKRNLEKGQNAGDRDWLVIFIISIVGAGITPIIPLIIQKCKQKKRKQ